MKDNQIDMITELLIDFDEMGFAPTTLCPDPEAYAIEWRKKLTEELKGYRKASEVAREIFDAFRDDMRSLIATSKKLFNECEDDYYEGKKDAFFTAIIHLDELIKKKYTEDGE